MELFSEWMGFRQTNSELPSDSKYTFSGTYNVETIPDLVKNSDLIEVQEALKLLPASYTNHFPTDGNMTAGKSMNEESKELLWINMNDTGTTYIFLQN